MDSLCPVGLDWIVNYSNLYINNILISHCAYMSRGWPTENGKERTLSHSTSCTLVLLANATVLDGRQTPKILCWVQTASCGLPMRGHSDLFTACRAQEVQSNDPCAELDRYLSDPLELPGIEMLNFWMVSLSEQTLQDIY